ACLAKRRIRILQQISDVFIGDFHDGVADNAVTTDLAIVTTIGQAALVAALPESQVALPAQRFDFVQAVRIMFRTVSIALPDAEFARLEVCLPEPQAVGAVDAEGEPAIDHDEV